MKNIVLAGFHAVGARLRMDPKSISAVYLDPERRDKRMREMREKLIAAGVLGVRTSRLSGAAGWLAISTGVTFLLWQWITQTLGEGNLLAGLASLIYAFVFFISAAKRV